MSSTEEYLLLEDASFITLEAAEMFLNKHFSWIPVKEVLGSLAVRRVPSGSFVLRQGTETKKAFILLNGEADLVILTGKLVSDENNDGIHRVRRICEGEVMNKIEMRFKCAALANIYAQTAVSILSVDALVYQKHFRRKADDEGTSQNRFASLLDVPKKYLCLLEQNSKRVSHQKGSRLFGIGDPMNKLYNLVEGDVEIHMPVELDLFADLEKPPLMRRHNRTKGVLMLSKGQFFGFENHDRYTYEARIFSVGTCLLETDLMLLTYVCSCCDQNLKDLSAAKLDIIRSLACSETQRTKSKPRESVTSIPKTDFNEEMVGTKSSRSVLYTDSLKSSQKAAKLGRIILTDIPQKDLGTNLYDFNCMKYGTSFRKKKFLELLKLLKLREQQIGNTAEIDLARKAIRRCQLSPFEIVQIQNDLTGGTPNMSHFTQMANKNRVKIIGARKAYQHLESESLSELKANRLRTEVPTQLLTLQIKPGSFQCK